MSETNGHCQDVPLSYRGEIIFGFIGQLRSPCLPQGSGRPCYSTPPSPLELLQVGLHGNDLGLYGLDRLPLLEELLLVGAVVPQPLHPGGPAFRCGQLPDVR